MKYLLFLLTGCWQTTLYIGPRVDSTGDVGFELGASMGASHPTTRSGAVTASVDTSLRLDSDAICATDCTTARGASPAPVDKPSRGTIRGILEWAEHPDVTADFGRASSIGWRAGVYAGAEFRGERNEPGEPLGLVGAQVTLSPWMWGLDDQRNTQYLGVGVQLGVEALADGRYVGRAALAIEGQYLPTLW